MTFPHSKLTQLFKELKLTNLIAEEKNEAVLFNDVLYCAVCYETKEKISILRPTRDDPHVFNCPYCCALRTYNPVKGADQNNPEPASVNLLDATPNQSIAEDTTYLRTDFINSNWRAVTIPELEYGYGSLSQRLNALAKSHEEQQKVATAQVMRLLAQACSMTLNATSINEPFQPMIKWVDGRRSAIADDFTTDDLSFFARILDDIDFSLLKARLADLLWLCRTPKNPDHARVAIDAYVSLPIDSVTWLRGVSKCWERAARLCLQIGEGSRLEKIEQQLYSAFDQKYEDSPLMQLRLAKLIEILGLSRDKYGQIAQQLFSQAESLQSNSDFNAARSYLNLAGTLYRKGSDSQGWLDSLAMAALCFEQEADQRLSGELPGQIVAN